MGDAPLPGWALEAGRTGVQTPQGSYSASRNAYAEQFQTWEVTILHGERDAPGTAEQQFGAMMEVDLVNDGPVTLWLERT